MGLLDSLKSLNPLGGLASMAENALDKVMPEAFGDIASGAINYMTGNFAGLAEDVADLGENVTAGVAGFLDGFFKSEPEAPTGTISERLIGKPDFGEKLESLQEAVQSLKAHTGRASGRSHAEPTTASGSSEVSADKTNNTSASGKSDASERAAETKATETKATETNGTNANANMSAEAFLKMATDDPDAFFKAVLANDIPDSIKNNPEMMRVLQMNVENISRMMNLLTNLMQAVHDMQMAVIRNVRA